MLDNIDTRDKPSAELKRRVHELRHSFHSPMDFGGGLIVKPWHVQRRFNRRLKLLQIPQSLAGMTVLDIGAWDGYFSFEFERRGAKRVLAIDTFAWNGPGFECFQLAHGHFGSKVEYQRMDAHDLDPAVVGTFDLVFCAGVLYHLRHPLIALEKIRSVTAGRLILETNSLIPALHEWVPQITFFAGDERAHDFSWHHGGFPTRAWVASALAAAGFARHEFVYTPSFKLYKKLVALATNRPQRGRLIAHAFAH